MRLLTDAAEDTNGANINIRIPKGLLPTHFYTLFVWGTFGGTTVTLQISPDDGTTWFNIVDADSITVKSVINLEFVCSHVRAITTGGTGATIQVELL